jgi:hypothetical protein
MTETGMGKPTPVRPNRESKRRAYSIAPRKQNNELRLKRNPMDEKKYVAITEKVMSDKTPLQVDIDIMSAWLLVSALQLTVKHPELSQPMKSMLTKIARAFQARIAEHHPEADELLEMGWNAAYDVDKDGKFISPVATCSHERVMVFMFPSGKGADLGCLDCDAYLDKWDGKGTPPEWYPNNFR